MAALSTIVDDTTDSGVSIRADLIPMFVANYERPLPVGLTLAQLSGGQGNVPKRFGYWGALSGSPASKTESDQFALVDATQAESTVTPAIIGYRSFLSDEATGSVGNDSVPAGFLRELLAGLVDQMDAAILAVSTSASNTSGTVTRDWTATEFRTDLAAFKALHPGVDGTIAVVAHGNGVADLHDSLKATTAMRPMSNGDSLDLGTVQGLQGTLYGVEVYESDNCPTESTGHSGLMTVKGAMSSFAVVINETPNIRPTRGDDAESRAGGYFVARTWYGAGLVYPNKCLEILTQ